MVPRNYLCQNIIEAELDGLSTRSRFLKETDYDNVYLNIPDFNLAILTFFFQISQTVYISLITGTNLTVTSIQVFYLKL